MFLDLAPRTVKKYSSSVDKWFAWAHTKKCKPLPADPNFLALFFIFQIKVCTSASTFNSIVSSIAWAHRKMGLISPTDNLLVKQIITAGRRILGRLPTNRKLPLLKSHVMKLFNKFYHSSLDDLQTLTLVTLGFVGFLRWDDLIQLTTRDIVFYKDYAAIFLERRKNDQYREGSWVYIASFDSYYCPVALVKKFLRIGKHEDGSALFRKVTHTRKGFALRRQKLSYGRALELVKFQLRQIGLDPTKYGLHSLRSGGASLAAAISVPDRQIMRHGGWQSESSKNRYIKEAKSSLLAVSKAFQF